MKEGVLIITCAHSLLVEECELKVLGKHKNPKIIIGDKHYLLACNSEKFEVVENS